MWSLDIKGGGLMRPIMAVLAGIVCFSWFITGAQAFSWKDRILGQMSSPNENRLAAAQYRKVQKQKKRRADKRRLYSKRSTKRKPRSTGRKTSHRIRIPARRYSTNARKGNMLRGLASYY